MAHLQLAQAAIAEPQQKKFKDELVEETVAEDTVVEEMGLSFGKIDKRMCVCRSFKGWVQDASMVKAHAAAARRIVNRWYVCACIHVYIRNARMHT